MNNITSDQIQYLLARSSMMGLKMFYISYCAHKTQKPFTFANLEKELSSFSLGYSQGWLVASHSFGLLQYTEKDDSYNIIEYDEELSKNIESFIEQRAKEKDKTKTPEWVEKYGYEKDIDEIRKSFGYKPKIHK